MQIFSQENINEKFDKIIENSEFFFYPWTLLLADTYPNFVAP